MYISNKSNDQQTALNKGQDYHIQLIIISNQINNLMPRLTTLIGFFGSFYLFSEYASNRYTLGRQEYKY